MIASCQVLVVFVVVVFLVVVFVVVVFVVFVFIIRIATSIKASKQQQQVV